MLSLAACPGGGAAGALRIALGAVLAKCWGSAGAAGRARGAVRAVGPVQRSVQCVLGAGGGSAACSALCMCRQRAGTVPTAALLPAQQDVRGQRAGRVGSNAQAVCGQGGQSVGRVHGAVLWQGTKSRMGRQQPCHVQGQAASGQCLGSAEDSTGWRCTGRAVCMGSLGHSIGSVGAVPWQRGQRAGNARHGYGVGRALQCTGSVGHSGGGSASLPSQPTRGTCRQ